MAQSLAKLLKKPVYTSQVWRAIHEAFDAGNLRSMVLTTAALIDLGLERLLRSRLRRLNSDDEDKLFGGLGTFSSMSVKIRVTYAMGIIGPITRRDLAAINDIRNAFAHSPHNITMRNKHLWSKVAGTNVGKAVMARYPGNKPKHGREDVLHGLLMIYALQLCTDRPKRVRLPVLKQTFARLPGVNLLRH